MASVVKGTKRATEQDNPDDDSDGRWVTVRGARIFISAKSGKITKGPAKFMGKHEDEVAGGEEEREDNEVVDALDKRMKGSTHPSHDDLRSTLRRVNPRIQDADADRHIKRWASKRGITVEKDPMIKDGKPRYYASTKNSSKKGEYGYTIGDQDYKHGQGRK